MGIREWLSISDVDAEVRSAREVVFSPDFGTALTSQARYGKRSRTEIMTAVATAFKCQDLIISHVGKFAARAFSDDDEERELDTPPLLRQPDPFMSRRRFQRSTVRDLLNSGYYVWQRTGPSTLRYLPANRVDVRWDPRLPPEIAEVMGARQFLLNSTDELDPSTIIYRPFVELPGEAAGIGPLEAQARTLDGQVAADDQVHSNFTRTPYPPGFLKAKSASEAKANEYKKKLMEGGREPLVLTGELEYETLQHNARDMQWIEARQWGASDVARYYGVPAAMLNLPTQGGSQITYNNAVSIRNDLLHTGLVTPIEQIEDGYDEALGAGVISHLDTRRYLEPLPSSGDGTPGGGLTDGVPAEAPALEPVGGNTAVA